MIDLKGKPFYLKDEDIDWIDHVKNSMTLDEKLGQLFCPIGFSAAEGYLEYEILSQHPGGLLFRSAPSEELNRAYTYLQKKSKVPMFLAANLESGGDGIIEAGTTFGKQLQAAATGDPEQAYRLGLVSCREAATAGGNFAFAPVVDIDYNYHNPITNVRTFGNDPEMVKQCGLKYLQAAKECGVAASPKHFPGDGVDECDQHILTSVNTMGCEEWDQTYGSIYQAMVEADTLTIMAGHIAMPSYQKYYNQNHPEKLVPATLSKELLQNLLREKLGFNGMIISDATPMVGFCAAMERSRAVPYAIEAGCDMFLFNKDYREDFGFMKAGYEAGILSETRLDEALTRILAAKAALGLHEKQKQGTLVPAEHILAEDLLKEHQEWSRECAEKAVTLVKDSQHLLPVCTGKHRRILLQILGDCDSNERVAGTFIELLTEQGFEVSRYEKEQFRFDGSVSFDSVGEFKSKYDLVLYIGNIENQSNKTTNRINWYTMFGLGNNLPWFAEEVPTVFISVANPYHLLDVPMIKTYINAYSNHDTMLEVLVEKLTGVSKFEGISPVDPFCGKEYLAYGNMEGGHE